MKDEHKDRQTDWEQGTEPALTPLGTPPAPPVRSREGDIIHTSPELAVGEADVRSAEAGVREPLAGTSLWKDAWRRLLKNKLAVFGMIVVGVILVASIIGPFIIERVTGFSYSTVPSEMELSKAMPPFRDVNGQFSGQHPMGTDILGRDLLARVLIGGRISLMVGIISTFVSLLIGITFGATAGYLGGRVDNVMMRIVDVLYSLPYMMIVIVLLAFFGGQLASRPILPALHRAGRGLVADDGAHRARAGDVAQEPGVRAGGAGDGRARRSRIIFRHLVPNTLGPVIVYATLTIPQVMLQEAFLSFLGLGVQAPLASWGSLASEGIQNIAIFPWQLIFPGVTMALTLFSLNFLGDGLRDALDPQMRKT